MKTRLAGFGVFVCVLCLVASAGIALSGGGHGEKKPNKEAILLVVFGTSVPEARKAFDGIETRVAKAFPGVELRWAYTSKIIRDKLGKKGENLDDPVTALAKLLDDDFNRIVVASFHTLPGVEFHELYQDVNGFRIMSGAHGRRILVSRPLLTSRQRMEAVAKGILKHVPKSRKPEDAVILMGHGSEHHPGDAVYAAMNYWAQDLDPNLFIGTVEGQPQLSDILPKLKKKNIKKAYLLPFMLVAGDHARNDMCGDEEDSWKSELKKNGIEVECVLKGTGEMPEIVDIWIEGVKAAHSHFK